MKDFDPPAEWLAESERWRASAAANWSVRDNASEPCRIRAWLGSPVAWDGYTAVCVEGALQYAVVLLESGQVPGEAYASIGRGWCPPPIPIADVTVIDATGRYMEIACCSVGISPPIAHETMRVRRRRARVDALNVPGILGTAGGWAKALNIPVPTLSTPWLDFHAVADVERLRSLLREVPNLARDAKRGLGSVIGWEVETTKVEQWLAQDGRLMRILPVCSDSSVLAPDMFDPSSFDLRESGTRAPYWHEASRTTCIVPRLQGAA